MAVLDFLHSEVKDIPTDPGVYLFLNEKHKILYVGKANNLRSRVRSYFGKTKDHRLVTDFVHRTARYMDFLVTDSEKDALLLENSLIKKHAPKFNVRLRDDKTYFSLRLDRKAKWPWFTIVRKRKEEEGVLYFGPYTSATACRQTLSYLNTMFPLRTCSDSVLANRSRPCISYEIKRCAAPCVDYITPEDYAKIVEDSVQFLKGKNNDLIRDLERRMKEASAKLDFESAALLRDRIDAIRTTVSQPHVTNKTQGAFDVIGLYRAVEETQLCVLFIRDGVLTASSSFLFEKLHDTDELLRSFLGQFYTSTNLPPAEVVLPEECAELPLIAETLAELRGAAVKIVVPERGEKRRQLLLADKNAELSYLQRHRDNTATEQTLSSLRGQLDLVRIPRRIECYDISNLMGTHVVGSGVAFMDGRPEKAKYRRYKIKTVDGQDDFASMAEVLKRRLKRGLKEFDLPDLVVIDGGTAQLDAVVKVFKELAVDQVDVISLAKARSGDRATSMEKTKERVFKPGLTVPIILDQKSRELKILMRIRDEAHRFAITYHRRLRNKAQITSILELVPGVGKQKAKAMLTQFGSVKGVREASDEDIETVKGMTPSLISIMRDFFATQGNLEDDLGKRESD
ncbi:MAG: excinuclease ABC subunit C [Planctomycetota bacterium]